MADFVKLSNLVNDEFTVQRVDGYKWKLWDTQNNQMLVSDDFVKGYSKKYTVETDKGTLDLGSGQLSSLLEAVFYNGKADIIGVTYKVKSNGKTGIDIRYYFNADRQAKPDLQQNGINDGLSGVNYARAQANALRTPPKNDTQAANALGQSGTQPLQTSEFSDADMPDFGSEGF